ncbi:MAG: NADH-quinone oxidoreductase subunit A [Chloroflexi bacterium]|nr:NADH-quinone oxidoreductase subunit A [Chloroflexota bacterium]
MQADYGYVALFLLIAVAFASVTLIIPATLRLLKVIPQKPSAVKGSPFECGMEATGSAWVQFNFRYYFYALAFLIIDVLVVFLYPWAVSARGLGTAGLVVILTLVGIVMVGYLYAWKKKVLEWM